VVRKSNYAGSTTENSGSSTSSTVVPSICSNPNQGFHTGQSYSPSRLEEKPLLEGVDAVDTWVNSHPNSDGDFLVSLMRQVEGSKVNGSDSDAPRVLVVDDHSASRMAAAALLAMEGYEVIEADSGYAAVALVTQKQPDLILLDIMMPGMDGFEVCQKVKQDEQTRLIPIIFITALNDK
jgi:putative two-component system response regulator